MGPFTWRRKRRWSLSYFLAISTTCVLFLFDNSVAFVPVDTLTRSNHRQSLISTSSFIPLTSLANGDVDGAVTPSSSSSTLSLSDASKWDDFDYLQHWYPMCWEIDMILNRPTKLTLFDVDYAVTVIGDPKQQNRNSRTSCNQAIAFEDACPHRGAALSEGRITSNGYLQCVYHGWSFDGNNGGKCVQIPQTITTAETSSSSSPPTYSTRACAKSVPAQIHQGMVWIWPGPVPKNDKNVPDASLLPTPPTIPELDDPNFMVTRTIRDFPMIDWSLLISNILDPDHGMFAHQMPAFDWYSASSNHTLSVKEDSPTIQVGTERSKGWNMKSTVNSVYKLFDVYNRRKGKSLKQPNKDKRNGQIFRATSNYAAPNVITLSRRDSNDETKFMNCFWVCPVGTGKSRFMAASAAQIKVRIPRWISHLSLLGFLDQDTVLVASQQPTTLSSEAELLEEDEKSRKKRKGARERVYAYQSPTDRTVRLIDSFFDATLSRVPNRKATLLELKRRGELRQIPPREVVLDRKVQHLQICPDSQKTVKNCDRIRQTSLSFMLLWTCARIFPDRIPGFVTTNPVLAVAGRVLRSSIWPIVASLGAWAATAIRKRFFYVYTKDKLYLDIDKIPAKTWMDPS